MAEILPAELPMSGLRPGRLGELPAGSLALLRPGTAGRGLAVRFDRELADGVLAPWAYWLTDFTRTSEGCNKATSLAEPRFRTTQALAIGPHTGHTISIELAIASARRQATFDNDLCGLIGHWSDGLAIISETTAHQGMYFAERMLIDPVSWRAVSREGSTHELYTGWSLSVLGNTRERVKVFVNEGTRSHTPAP